jgi:hypothetical protein
MPYGVFPVPKRRDSGKGAPASTSLAVRIRTRLARAALDSELANGADPASSAELALRAEQLSSPAERARIANGLVEALGDARRGEPMTLRPAAAARGGSRRRGRHPRARPQASRRSARRHCRGRRRGAARRRPQERDVPPRRGRSARRDPVGAIGSGRNAGDGRRVRGASRLTALRLDVGSRRVVQARGEGPWITSDTTFRASFREFYSPRIRTSMRIGS